MKLIHFNGKYKEQPFISVNCSAMSEDLLERELFGYVSGAFIGAERDQKGKFELSRDGTIFFDEISELSLRLQSKLLKVIQEKGNKKNRR